MNADSGVVMSTNRPTRRDGWRYTAHRLNDKIRQDNSSVVSAVNIVFSCRLNYLWMMYLKACSWETQSPSQAMAPMYKIRTHSLSNNTHLKRNTTRHCTHCEVALWWS